MNKINKLTKWQERWVEQADNYSKWSKDQTKIGAVIVDDEFNSQLAMGYNGIPRGVEDDIKKHPERYDRESGEKYYWAAHAERNVIYNCARDGISTLGKTMYLNCSVPCTGCSIAIIQSGIKKIVCKVGNTTGNKEKWDEEAKRSKQMLIEAGVQIIFYD